jgi:hypothetical protein
MRLLLEAGADQDIPASVRNDAMMRCVFVPEANFCILVCVLRPRLQDGWTTLYVASWCGQLECVRACAAGSGRGCECEE